MDRFGERVLGAPKNRGLARAAWAGPFVILAIGVVLIVFYLRRVRAPVSPRSETPPLDAALRERIEDELKARQS